MGDRIPCMFEYPRTPGEVPDRLTYAELAAQVYWHISPLVDEHGIGEPRPTAELVDHVLVELHEVRFPMGPPNWRWEGGEEGPSESGLRPSSLRGVVAGPVPDTELKQYGYCEKRQIGTVHVGEGLTVPLLKHTKPGPTPVTSGGPDGNAPGEEVSNQDYDNE